MGDPERIADRRSLLRQLESNVLGNDHAALDWDDMREAQDSLSELLEKVNVKLNIK